MSYIQILSDEIVNQIAAGEIIERPASIVKELIENAIDANCTNIEIFLQNAGRTKLVIEDNGMGICHEELLLAVQRHATSKLTGANLFDITSYGFRGEALPSIASISQFSIESDGMTVCIDFGGKPRVLASSIAKGTRITVQNMFDRLPARLKFLKSDNIELSRSLELIENFAITHPTIEFSVRDSNKILLSFTKSDQKTRIATIIGNEALSRSMFVSESDNILSIYGYFGHPVDSRYSQGSQRIFINNRWIKDKIVSSAIKTAFKDLLPAGRFATCVLSIEINPFYLDINVSPTKSEVRFRDTQYVQKFITQAIQKNLHQFDKISLCVDDSKLVVPHTLPGKIRSVNPSYSDTRYNKIYDSSCGNLACKADPIEQPGIYNKSDVQNNKNKVIHLYKDNTTNRKNMLVKNTASALEIDTLSNTADDNCLPVSEIKNESFWGEPIGQILDTYIICKTDNELVIIDQHAVHEKITMNRMLKNININNKQYLTRPELMSLTKNQVRIMRNILDQLIQCGFSIDLLTDTINISAIPTVMKLDDVKQFLSDLMESPEVINELDVKDTIKLKIANMACHNSIRAGRELTIVEMQALIKEMEQTDSIHQCNHHRPSFVKITKKQLESIFERS